MDRKTNNVLLRTEFAEEQFERCTLPNGIRLVHQRINTPVAYCSLTVNAGSRDELDCESGVAHLTEHLIFKETGKRKSHHILSRMESVGGDLNAYTSKEETCIHAAFLSAHYPRAIELFHDIVFNHRITDKILLLEKSVVVDEIKSSKDSPSEQIFDEFDSLLFPGHSLGRSTLGSVQSVNRLLATDVERFVAGKYIPSQIVLSSVGNIPFQRFADYCEKYFGGIPERKDQFVMRTAPSSYVSFKKETGKRNHQAHCIIGRTCNSTDNEYRTAMTMLANMLGGSGMNSRLSMSLRERLGLVYHVESSYTPYSDTGVFQIYFASDRNKTEKCVLQIEKELDRLKKTPLTAGQLRKQQVQMMGQIAVASDNNDTRMQFAGKSILMYDNIDNLHDICGQIGDVSAERVCEIANEVFCDLSFLTYY